MAPTTETADLIEALREREERGEPLGESEQATLTAFYARLEKEEAERLAPAIKRMRRERRAQQRVIAELVELRAAEWRRLAHVVPVVCGW